jgi:tetratricopeptide (TPR) repeat protein
LPATTLTEALTASEGRKKILLLTPAPVNDSSRLQPETELREIYGVLDGLRTDVDIIRLNPPTVDNLRFAIATRKFAIIHVATHGDASGIELEEVDGTVSRVSIARFAELFHGCARCLLILNGCSTEPFGDELARIAPDVTTISIAGGIMRQSAVRAISTIYGLLVAGVAAEEAAMEGTRIIQQLGDNAAEVRATGRHIMEPAFSVTAGEGRPTYYPCTPRTNMPPRRMPIFDREAEILSLHEALFDGGPYIGLVGITGNGKTTLLQAAVGHYGWRFPDGIGYFSLRADLSLVNLVDIFKWPTPGAEISRQDISARLSEGRYLLIFDDAEDARPEAVREILALLNGWDTSLGGRAVIVLHTRRPEFTEAIGTNWIPVRGLPADAAQNLVEVMLGSKEEAHRKLGDDLAVVPSLCFGHPKTIESTASLLQLGERWSEVKDDLVRLSGQGPLNLNSEMMGRVITRLESAEPGVRDLLDAWAVFEDRCRVTAWREVALSNVGGDGNRRGTALDRALRALHGATLIERYDEDNEGRCVMHPLLVSHLRPRHAGLSGEKAADLVRAQLTLQVRMASADRYPTEESGNVRRALRVGRQLGMWPELLAYCQSIAGDSDLPLARRGPWPLARDILDLAVEAARHGEDLVQEAKFLLVRGMVEYRLAELESAESFYQKAAELAADTGEDSIWLAAMRGVGRVRYRMGDFTAAQEVYVQAKSAQHEDAAALADIDHELGKVLYRKGELAEARELFASAREVRERSGAPRDLARSLHELARVEHAAGELALARRLYMEALHLERANNDPVTEQATLFQLGRLELDEGNLDEAEDWLDDSARVTARLGDRIWMVHGEYGRALLAWARGDTATARREARLAFEEARRLGIGLALELQEWVEVISRQDAQREGR